MNLENFPRHEHAWPVGQRLVAPVDNLKTVLTRLASALEYVKAEAARMKEAFGFQPARAGRGWAKAIRQCRDDLARMGKGLRPRSSRFNERSLCFTHKSGRRVPMRAVFEVGW